MVWPGEPDYAGVCPRCGGSVDSEEDHLCRLCEDTLNKQTPKPKAVKKDKDSLKKDQEGEDVICANCGKKYHDSSFGVLCRYILRHKPACSYECNLALGDTNWYNASYETPSHGTNIVPQNLEVVELTRCFE